MPTHRESKPSAPPNIQDVVVMRVLVRHGFSRDMADLLLKDVRRSIEHLHKHPVGVAQSPAEGTTFTHHGVARVVKAPPRRPSRAAPPKAELVPAE